MPNSVFFADTHNSQVFRTAATVLEAQPAAPENQKLITLGRTWSIFGANASVFDEACQVNIKWMGHSLLNCANQIRHDINSADIGLALAVTYRFVIEYDLSIGGDLNDELQNFKNFVANLDVGHHARDQIRYAEQSMPLAITKRILNSKDLGSLRNVESIAATMNARIEEWEEKLSASESKVDALRGILSQQEQAFNFVGLHQGFAKLEDQVAKELRSVRHRLISFGVLLTLPSLVDLAIISLAPNIFNETNWIPLAAGAFTSITLTLFFLYFFRIALRSADSCRAQLVQIRLRMTLCAFIQNYAEYSKSIKESNADALSKFESLIFSGLVMTDQNLPSTFDGIEQLAGLAKSIRGSK